MATTFVPVQFYSIDYLRKVAAVNSTPTESNYARVYSKCLKYAQLGLTSRDFTVAAPDYFDQNMVDAFSGAGAKVTANAAKTVYTVSWA